MSRQQHWMSGWLPGWRGGQTLVFATAGSTNCRRRWKVRDRGRVGLLCATCSASRSSISLTPWGGLHRRYRRSWWCVGYTLGSHGLGTGVARVSDDRLLLLMNTREWRTELVELSAARSYSLWTPARGTGADTLIRWRRRGACGRAQPGVEVRRDAGKYHQCEPPQGAAQEYGRARHNARNIWTGVTERGARAANISASGCASVRNSMPVGVDRPLQLLQSNDRDR